MHGLAAGPSWHRVFWRWANERLYSIRVDGILGALRGQETGVEHVVQGRDGMVGLRSEYAVDDVDEAQPERVYVPHEHVECVCARVHRVKIREDADCPPAMGVDGSHKL